MNKYIYTILATISLVAFATACTDFLDREPLSQMTPESYFENDTQVGEYLITYYTTWFPEAVGDLFSAGPAASDAGTDDFCTSSPNYNLFGDKGHWLVPAAQALSFSNIRTVNYFLNNVPPKFEAGKISGNTDNIKHYIGEAYFMRAYEYFKQLKTYGDFPIVTEVLPDEKETLMIASERAPRNEVARFIIADLDSAIVRLKSGSAYGKVRIGKEAALLLKSRVALYEATFEKYHNGTPRVPGSTDWPGASKSYNAGKTFDINSEITWFLGQAMDAAKQVADAMPLTENNHVIVPAPGVLKDDWNPYSNMFSAESMNSYSEVILWRDYDSKKSVFNRFRGYLCLGYGAGHTRSCIDSYLMANGLPIYASNSGYKGDKNIVDQFDGRDERLGLFVFSQNDPIENAGVDKASLYWYPNLTDVPEECDITGFRCRKYYTVETNNHTTNSTDGTNGFLIFRASEAYLNYIEASYLKNGSIDATAAAYWKAIRERAGVSADYNKTISATDLSKENDWAKYSGSQIVDKTLYNIRRERRNELFSEGFRMDDLKRWRSYDALYPENMGHYIPEGCNFWDELYKSENYYADPKDLTSEWKIVEAGDGVEGANMSAKSDSKYIRPYRKYRLSNEVYDGYRWNEAYYLSPLGHEDISATSADGTAGNSHSYQNPYWGTTAGSQPTSETR